MWKGSWIGARSDGASRAGTFEDVNSDLGIPAPYGRNIAPMRVYHRRGRLIGESQERVARAKPLPGDVGVSPTTAGGCGGVPLTTKIPLLLASL